MPTSGGLYYAAAVLAPPGWGPFAAWVTGESVLSTELHLPQILVKWTFGRQTVSDLLI